jgi:hypothetical protein
MAAAILAARGCPEKRKCLYVLILLDGRQEEQKGRQRIHKPLRCIPAYLQRHLHTRWNSPPSGFGRGRYLVSRPESGLKASGEKEAGGVVVARVVWQKEQERWENGDLAEIDPDGRLQIKSYSGEVIDTIEAGDWIDAQVDDGPIIQPLQAF